jgi:hypothetical protein
MDSSDKGKIKFSVCGESSGAFSVPINIVDTKNSSLGGYKLKWDSSNNTLIFEKLT